MAEIQRLTEDDVLLVRRRMAELAIATQDAFGQTEPLHPDKLSSAVFRQETGAGGTYKYNTIADVGATLFYGVAMSHSFENGNKRTALVSLLVFLDKNKTLLVTAGEDELYELARSVAAHEIPIKGSERNVDSEVKAVAEWIREHTRDKILGDTAMDFKELRTILEALGCEFDKHDQNFIKIRNGGYMVKTGYPRANFEVQVGEMKRIRRSLHLDEIHGVDSAGFYSLEEKVDGFVNTYRNLMKRLADL
ncbi:MAG: type II toxin-antitoxin system death-on-curing family toxin [Xanthomonadales bacterium]|nr:type II toxin-antitoxin system death-on-curing family toxin [Xanthomonadales bacterium]